MRLVSLQALPPSTDSVETPQPTSKNVGSDQNGGGGREGGRTEKPQWKFLCCPVLLNIFHSTWELTIISMLIISCIHIDVVIVLVPSSM